MTRSGAGRAGWWAPLAASLLAAAATGAAGAEQADFRTVSLRRHAADNAAVIARDSLVRMVIGSRDETFGDDLAFHDHPVRLGIPHDWIVVEGVGHDPMRLLQTLGDRHWAFYRKAFD